MSAERKQNVLVSLHPTEAEIGYALAAIEDARQRTHAALEGIGEDTVDWSAPQFDHTIGTLLYHIAAIEVDWLLADVMGGDDEAEIWDWFPYDVRDDSGRLIIVKGISLQKHWERLDMVRVLLMKTYQAMTRDDFHRPRQMEGYTVSPAWVLHHLCQHEAEHRMELRLLRTAADRS